MMFSTHNYIFPLKKQLFGDAMCKICMLCVFRCADKILSSKW